jgi:hypothetical protein
VGRLIHSPPTPGTDFRQTIIAQILATANRPQVPYSHTGRPCRYLACAGKGLSSVKKYFSTTLAVWRGKLVEKLAQADRLG